MTVTTPYADVFLGSDERIGVTEASFISSEFEHEMAVLTLDGHSPTAKRFQTGTPVRVDWGARPVAARSFYGYVNHSVPITNPLKDERSPDGPAMRVVCVAPTWVYKEGGFRTFRSMAAPTAIRQLAQEARFDTKHIATHDKVWPVLHQGGKSEWEFMVECAKKIGWTLFARGLELHCIDRKKAIEQNRSSAPILFPATQGGSIRKFQSNQGSTAPSGGDLRVRDAFGINPRTSRVLARRNKGNTDRPLFGAAQIAPTFGSAVTDIPFESLDEVDSKLGAVESLNRMPIEATLVGGFNPRVFVGQPVYIVGLSEADNGHWYVRSATQTVRGGANPTEMKLTLGRDTASSTTSVVPTGSKTTSPRGARLLNRQWVLG